MVQIPLHHAESPWLVPEGLPPVMIESGLDYVASLTCSREVDALEVLVVLCEIS